VAQGVIANFFISIHFTIILCTEHGTFYEILLTKLSMYALFDYNPLLGFT